MNANKLRDKVVKSIPDLHLKMESFLQLYFSGNI